MITGRTVWSIGQRAVKNRVVAAPMAGISDKAFRIVAASFGCGLTFTEMISDKALIYGNHRTLQMLDISCEPVEPVVQLFGSEPESLKEAAILAEEKGATVIDINMGCPTPKIVKNGEGVALMLDLKRAQKVIREVVRGVSVPVTVKMRKGWDSCPDRYLDLGLIAEGEGAAALTLHPRTKEQLFQGKADVQAIKKLKETVKIPVIGNGDIFCPEDAARMINETGCDAVMIGRGALGNPFLFRAVEALLGGRSVPPPPSLKERIGAAVYHLDLAIQHKGEERAVLEMRKHLGWYLKGVPKAARLRELINQARTRKEVVAWLLEALGLEESDVWEGINP